MKIYELKENKQIVENEEIYRVIEHSMFNPTYGRIKSAAEGIYGKQQGHFYVCEDEFVIGIIGVRRVDNAYVEIMHIAVVPEKRNQGIGTSMINYIRDAERVDEIIAHPEEKAVGFFEKVGFSVKESVDNMTGLVRFVCKMKG